MPDESKVVVDGGDGVVNWRKHADAAAGVVGDVEEVAYPIRDSAFLKTSLCVVG